MLAALLVLGPPRLLGDWQLVNLQGQGNSLLKLTSDGRYVQETPTQTKPDSPIVGTYTVRRDASKGLLVRFTPLRSLSQSDFPGRSLRGVAKPYSLRWIASIPALVKDADWAYVPARSELQSRRRFVVWSRATRKAR